MIAVDVHAEAGKSETRVLGWLSLAITRYSLPGRLCGAAPVVASCKLRQAINHSLDLSRIHGSRLVHADFS